MARFVKIVCVLRTRSACTRMTRAFGRSQRAERQTMASECRTGHSSLGSQKISSPWGKQHLLLSEPQPKTSVSTLEGETNRASVVGFAMMAIDSAVRHIRQDERATSLERYWRCQTRRDLFSDGRAQRGLCCCVEHQDRMELCQRTVLPTNVCFLLRPSC